MASPPSKKKRIAHAINPTMEAIIHGLFRFEKGQQAISMMSRIRTQFVLSKDQQDEHTIKLWIKGYSVTPEEEKNGFLGHFALISCQFESGKFTLHAEKLDTPLKQHPQRHRPPQKQPDWGHPVLRYVLRRKEYDTLDAARDVLMKMHEEFPETSIPGVDKLNLIVYNRKATPPIEKLTLRIEPVPGSDKVVIVHAENKPKKEMPTLGDPKPESKGYYTTLVKKRRDKKKK